MDVGVKLFVVTCDKCGGKQVWTPDTTNNPCLGCESVIVKKTIDSPAVKAIKAVHKARELSYSDYEVYTIFPSDIDIVRGINRTKKIAAFKEKLAHKKSVYTNPPKVRY